MCLSFLEISVLSSLRAKLLFPFWDDIPCKVHIFVIEGLESVLNSVRNQVSSDEQIQWLKLMYYYQVIKATIVTFLRLRVLHFFQQCGSNSVCSVQPQYTIDAEQITSQTLVDAWHFGLFGCSNAGSKNSAACELNHVGYLN